MEDTESSSSCSTERPKILVVSNSNTKPKSLIKLITGSTSVADDNGIVVQPWPISTKYYTTTVDFYGIDEHFVRSNDFNASVEALIIHTDCNKAHSLKALEKWAPIEDECDLEIKLLVSNYCNDQTAITKLQATEWCLKRGFEFIELYRQGTTKETDESEIIREKFGVERVIEALQSHVWPNLVLNEDSQKETGTRRSRKQGGNEADEGNSIDQLLDNEEDDFTELFTQLHLIKDSMKTIPHSQRKQCAEQVVTAFWKAIGGDPEEINDI